MSSGTKKLLQQPSGPGLYGLEMLHQLRTIWLAVKETNGVNNREIYYLAREIQRESADSVPRRGHGDLGSSEHGYTSPSAGILLEYSGGPGTTSRLQKH